MKEYIDAKDVVQTFIASWRAIVSLAIGITIVVYFSLGLIPKQYTAEAKFKVGNTKQDNDDPLLVAKMLETRKVALNVINIFKLNEIIRGSSEADTLLRFRSMVKITVGKIDGYIGVEVSTPEPMLSAQIANYYYDAAKNEMRAAAATKESKRRKLAEEDLKRAIETSATQTFPINANELRDSHETDIVPKLIGEIRAVIYMIGVESDGLNYKSNSSMNALELVNTLSSLLTAKNKTDNCITKNKKECTEKMEYFYQKSVIEKQTERYKRALIDEDESIKFAQQAEVPLVSSSPKITLITAISFLTVLILNLIIRQALKMKK